MSQSNWVSPEIIVQILTFAATASAVIVAWRIPHKVAILAEAMRIENEKKQEIRRLKNSILTTIMQERACIYSEAGVKALNSIDIIFSDSTNVREAWASLYNSLSYKPYTQFLVSERLTKLLQCIADDMDIGGTLRLDDFNRIYFPEAMAKERAIRDDQRDKYIQEILNRPQVPEAATNSDTSRPISDMFPPPPVD